MHVLPFMLMVHPMQVRSIAAIKCSSMLEYIQGGMEINLTMCIDYTASNGEFASWFGVGRKYQGIGI